MKLTYRNTFYDRLVFSAYNLARNPVMIFLTVFCILLVTFGIILPAFRELPAGTSVFAKVVGFVFAEMLFLGGFLAFVGVFTTLSMISRKNKPLFCERTITLGEDGFIGESEFGKSEVRWATVQKLVRTRKYILIYLSQDSAVVVPRRAFENKTQWESFYDICSQRINRSV